MPTNAIEAIMQGGMSSPKFRDVFNYDGRQGVDTNDLFHPKVEWPENVADIGHSLPSTEVTSVRDLLPSGMGTNSGCRTRSKGIPAVSAG